MLSEAQIQQFKATGYLNGGKVLDDDTVETLRAEMMRMQGIFAAASARISFACSDIGGVSTRPARRERCTSAHRSSTSRGDAALHG